MFLAIRWSLFGDLDSFIKVHEYKNIETMYIMVIQEHLDFLHPSSIVKLRFCLVHSPFPGGSFKVRDVLADGDELMDDDVLKFRGGGKIMSGGV